VLNTDGEDVFPPMEGQDLPVSQAGQGTGAIQLRNLQLQKPGIYSFVVTIDGAQIGARDLVVEPLPGQAAPTPARPA